MSSRVPKLPPLDYAITRAYPWARFTELVLVVSLVVLIPLTAVNSKIICMYHQTRSHRYEVAATGYEPVTFSSENFNYKDRFWW